MKTIEERAKDYAPDAFDVDFIVPVSEGYIVKVQRNAYKQGATEQKAIDDAEKEQLILKAKSIVKEMFSSFTAGLTLKSITKEFETKLRNVEYGDN